MKKSLSVFLLTLALFSGCSKKSTPESTQAGKPLQITFPAVTFTNLAQVSKGQASPAVMDHLISLLDATPKDAHLHLNIFLFSYQPLIDALSRASDRGVALHLMLDLSRDESLTENPMTISKIRRFLKPNSEIITVTSDAGSTSINHNKFVIFSELNTAAGLQPKVVFQSSHNFTLSDSKKIQDGLTLAHPGLYDAYLTYWEDMKTKAATGMKNFSYWEYHDAPAGISALFFPKRRNGTAYGSDTVIELLDGITEPNTATVRVAMSDWVASRLNVVTKLEQLVDEGATVEVIAKDKVDPEILQGLERLRTKGAFVKIYKMSQINNHSKIILLSGKWKGEPVNMIITGSHNFTQNALRNNNEVMLQLKNQPQLFQTYLAYYNEMKKLPGI